MADEGRNDLTITRTFDVSREILWKYWTVPEYMKRWWGPNGYTSPIIEVDLRVGGKYLNDMRSPEGKDYWSTGIYEEIVPLEKIVVTDSFADQNGNIVPSSYYGMPGDFPLSARIIVTLEEVEGKTRMTLRHLGLPEGEMREQTAAGWNESFDKLDAEFMKLAA